MNPVHGVIVITSCTSRKRKVGTVLQLETAHVTDSLSNLAHQWKQQVQTVRESDLLAARDLYAGRSISEAKQTADALFSPLYIVSAGHGVLHANELVPAYDVTVSPAPDNRLHCCLLRLQKSPADWWQALIEAFGPQRSLAELITRSTHATVLLAVPSVYLRLLEPDLACLSDADIQRLRVLTSYHGATRLAPRLQHLVMPYDERLEGLPTFAGTRSDFPQRALRHFTTVLQGHELSLESAREQVSQAMAALQKPVLPERQRKTDDDIVTLLRQNWERLQGSSTAL
ncbi:DUF6884 domain-containing protein, partial [Massilia phosphatilytica]